MARVRYLHHILRDTLIVLASIVLAYLLLKEGAIESFLASTGDSLIISSFLAGAFFTSIFTIAPAGVALVAIGQSYHPLAVALFGALGAMCVDLGLLLLVRKDLTSAEMIAGKVFRFRRLIIKGFHFGLLKWFAFIAGIFLIASPAPDEVGLFLLGASKINSKLLPAVFFTANFLGIWAILSIAAAL